MKILIGLIIIITLFLLPRILTANSADKNNHLINGLLKVCPGSPNCVNTDGSAKQPNYQPQLALDFSDTQATQIMALAKQILLDMGAEIRVDETHYIAVTFTSSFFGFTDDLELRQDNTHHKLHIRSASRTGYSDFGVNKRRVEEFLLLMKTQLKTSP